MSMRCPECQREADEEDLFCTNCGTALTPSEADSPPRIEQAAADFDSGEIKRALDMLRHEGESAESRGDVEALERILEAAQRMVEELERGQAPELASFERLLFATEHRLDRVKETPPRLRDAQQAAANGDLAVAVELLHAEIAANDKEGHQDSLRQVVRVVDEIKSGLEDDQDRRAFEHVLAAAQRRLEGRAENGGCPSEDRATVVSQPVQSEAAPPNMQQDEPGIPVEPIARAIPPSPPAPREAEAPVLRSPPPHVQSPGRYACAAPGTAFLALLAIAGGAVGEGALAAPFTGVGGFKIKTWDALGNTRWIVLFGFAVAIVSLFLALASRSPALSGIALAGGGIATGIFIIPFTSRASYHYLRAGPYMGLIGGACLLLFALMDLSVKAQQPASPIPAGRGPAPAPPGWYPDPSGRAQFRYWSGQTWTEATHE